MSGYKVNHWHANYYYDRVKLLVLMRLNTHRLKMIWLKRLRL